MPPTQSGISLDRNRVKNPKSHSTENQKLCDTRPYGDLLVVTLLGTPAPPPAGLALRGLLLLATALGLPATLGRLPLRGCLPAGSATTSLRCHGACSTLVLLRRETTKRTKKTNKYVSMGSAGLHYYAFRCAYRNWTCNQNDPEIETNKYFKTEERPPRPFPGTGHKKNIE